VYDRLNRRAGAEENPFAPTDLRPLVEDIPRFYGSPGDRARGPDGLDVVIYAGLELPAGRCDQFAKYGLWSIGFGDPSLASGLPLYFREMERRAIVSDLALFVHTARFESGRVIYHYRTPTHPSRYYCLNASDPMSMAPVLLIRRLLDVQRYGWAALRRLRGWSDEIPVKAPEGFPGTWTLLWFLFRHTARRLWQRVVYRLRGEAKWFVCLRRNSDEFTARQDRFASRGFTPVPSPPHSTLADPFLFRHDGRVFLFVEEIVTATGQGHFSFCEVLPQGLSEFQKIIEKPWHLSYPCVIEWNGDIFMIPESGGNFTLDLYKAESFPFAWRIEKRIQEGIALVDTTPLYHNGVWYFFTTTIDVATSGKLETWLFCADQLDGEWNYHPANPICSDVRRARSAGHLFYRGEKLIRPSQDCSVRYGYAIVLNWVLKLTPDEYEEQVEEVILPDWMPGIFATHTLNAVEGVEAIDATRIPVSKP
jgi:hypothetical protein